MSVPRIREDLADLEPYDPDMRDVEVMLSANENAYGLPPQVRAEMLRRMAEVPAHRYPEALCPRLRGLLAEMWGIPPRSVVVGNGGDELIFDLLLAFGGAERTAVICPPTFSAYELYARLTGTDLAIVPRNGDFSLDEAATFAAASRARIVFITSPNNPSGNLVRPGFIRDLAEGTDALIVVDEAYAEFADPAASCVPLVGTSPNVCVLRTLSKAYALAGARVGYVIASDAVADALRTVRQPYSVSRFDQIAGETVIEMRDLLAVSRQALIEERAHLIGGLEDTAAALEARCGRPAMRIYPSEANFVLIRVAAGDGVPGADEIHERLAGEYGILVRNVSSAPGLAGCLRITVGTPEEDARFIAALREITGADASVDTTDEER